MSTPSKVNFKMYQGSTFSEVLHWESNKKVYIPISNIGKSAPTVITTSSAHSIPGVWRVRVTNVGGMKEINSADDEYYLGTSITSTTIELNAVNSLGYTAYTSGGVVEYNEPVNLTGFTARMQLREKLDSTTILAEYTTENGKLIVDTATSKVTINVDAITTAGYTFNTAVYSLELVSSGGQVNQLITGNITLVKEVTR
jgi:hypothetical protein